MSGPESDAEAVVADFAEQFAIDVSAIGAEQRAAVAGSAWATARFGVVVQMFIADFVPRVRAGCEALGVGASTSGGLPGRSRGTTTPIRPTSCSTTFCPRWRGCVQLDPVTDGGGPAARRGAAQLPAVQVAARERRRWTPADRSRCTATSSSSRRRPS